jgi:hypothetical protein
MNHRRAIITDKIRYQVGKAKIGFDELAVSSSAAMEAISSLSVLLRNCLDRVCPLCGSALNVDGTECWTGHRFARPLLEGVTL